MFYLENREIPQGRLVLGSKQFERILRNYVIDTSELTTAQYETFKGTLFALNLHKELIPSVCSWYVVGFVPDE